MATYKESKLKELDSQKDFDNLKQWHNAGVTGIGVTVWNLQGYSSHGKMTTERVLDSAPDCTVINASPTTGVDRSGDCHIHSVTFEGARYDIEEFIRKFNIKIITSSKQDLLNKESSGEGKFWSKLSEDLDICMFQSSGNDGKMRDFSNNVGMIVGACKLEANRISRELYADYGEGIDFVDFTGGYKGTSFSTPYLAGKCALIRQRYPWMTHKDVYDYMRFSAQVIDEKTGSGILIMPQIGDENEVVTKTNIKIIKDGKESIVSVDRILKDGTNYIRLRDFEDVLGICDVDYDEKDNLPIVKR